MGWAYGDKCQLCTCPQTKNLLWRGTGCLSSQNPRCMSQGATPTSDKARRPTPTTGDRGRRWRLIGKEGPASKVLSGTYENVAEVGTGRVALSMQRLRQGGILRNDFNDFNLESLRLSLSVYLYTSIALCSMSRLPSITSRSLQWRKR